MPEVSPETIIIAVAIIGYFWSNRPTKKDLTRLEVEDLYRHCSAFLTRAMELNEQTLRAKNEKEN